MYAITIIIFLMPFIEVISSGRSFPYHLNPGGPRISLSPNMFRKTKETKEDMETYLQNNAPYRKYNRAPMEKPKRTRDDLEQYLYEKYNDFRKSFSPRDKPKQSEELKYFYDNAPYRKSMQQFRSLPVLVIALKNNIKDSRLDPDDDSLYLTSKKFLRTDDNIEDVNKKVLRLGAEGRLKCIAVKTRRKQVINYDSTSSSSSREFHSGEKRQFKMWREQYVCGDQVMPKYIPPPDDQSLRPTRYKSTNRLLNEMVEEKRWREGGLVKVKKIVTQAQRQTPYKGVISPLRKTDVNQYLVPPRVEFELRELVV